MSVSDVFSTLMKVRRVVAIISIVAGAGYKLSPMVWHKVQPEQTKPVLAADSGTNSTSLKKAGCDLGEVSLTNHFETCVKLGGGKNCFLSPKMLDGHNLQITFALESKNDSGKTHDLTVAQVVTHSGKPVEVALGDFNLTLTPKMSAE